MISPEIPHPFEDEPGAEDPIVTELRKIYLDAIPNSEVEDIPVGCSIAEALGIFYGAWYDRRDMSDDQDPSVYLIKIGFLSPFQAEDE